MNLFLKLTSGLCLISALCLLVGLRVIGIDLTEGQLLYKYYLIWVLTIVLALVGAFLLSKIKDK